MHLLGSNWLRKMAEKSGPTPLARLAGLADTLDDWLQAPCIEENLREQLLAQDAAELAAFRALVLDLANPLRPRNPQELADQIVFLLLGAIQQQLRAPESRALLQAREAMLLLADAATSRQQTPSIRPQPAALALAACLCLMLVAGLVAPWLRLQPSVSPQATSSAKAQSALAVSYSPDELVALHQQHEQLARGDCFYPMALMLPEGERRVYLNFVGKTPMIGASDMNKESLGALRHALSGVACSYPQIAMVSS